MNAPPDSTQQGVALDEVAEAALRAIDLALPEACVPGVIANRALLDRHRAAIERFFADRR